MKKLASLLFAIVFAFNPGKTQSHEQAVPELENPMSVSFLKERLNKEKPRLVYNKGFLNVLREEVVNDEVTGHMYEIVKHNALEILEQAFSERVMTGRRLLSVSREMLYRINMLGAVYLVEEDERILDRINGEVLAVCSFTDWNPSHFLDVAEMSLAVALALDWTMDRLPEETISLAKKALIEKGIKAGWPDEGRPQPWWVTGNNNWNQVCHGGMVAASIAVAEEEPELAAKTIRRALDFIPNALSEYMPDGVYPEVPGYWTYGTSYTVVTSEMLMSAFGTDFGIRDYPGFLESAVFKTMCHAPSGLYFNYFDCGDRRPSGGDIILAWFGNITGNGIYFERDRFLSTETESKADRLGGAALAWISQFDEITKSGAPKVWFGNGKNPLVIFREESGENSYYLGAKGGCGSLNHGNMDAGSFVFELDGVRWVIDPGVQGYNELEQAGFDLWASCQTCDRWKLLTKNNFGHSTITVNNELHKVDGRAGMTETKYGSNPEVSFNMTPAFEGLVDSAQRRFVRSGQSSLLVEDEININQNTKTITWQLITTADVEIVDGGAILRLEGQELKLYNLTHPDIPLSIVSLDPPPLDLDKRIPGLKRIELNIPVKEGIDTKNQLEIRIKLEG